MKTLFTHNIELKVIGTFITGLIEPIGILIFVFGVFIGHISSPLISPLIKKLYERKTKRANAHRKIS